MRLSLVIPCYNEAKNIPLLLERCASITEMGVIEVILVDNGSTDGSQKVLETLLPAYPGCRSIRVSINQGYGFGILSGLQESTADLLAWTHADLQTDPNDALRGLELFNAHGNDIFVKGRRYGRPIGDSIFTLGMSVFETILLGKVMWDINAQPTMFSREFFMQWQSPPKDFSLDLFAYFFAKKLKIPVYRLPVFFGSRAHGVSHWNIGWASKWKFIKRTIAYSFKLRRGFSE